VIDVAQEAEVVERELKELPKKAIYCTFFASAALRAWAHYRYRQHQATQVPRLLVKAKRSGLGWPR